LEPLIHFAFPFVLSLSTQARLRWAFLAGLIGVLPDLDVLFFAHPSPSHSILPSLILAAASLTILNRSKLRTPVLLSAMGLGSHGLLDLTENYVPIIWPLSQDVYQLVLTARLHMRSSSSITWALEILGRPYDYAVFRSLDTWIFTAQGLTIAAILLATGVALELRRRAAPPSSQIEKAESSPLPANEK